jgi:hypothetical protein
MRAALPRTALGLAALLLGISAPASAERATTEQYTAQSRPRIVIRPHYPGPNAKRYCNFWLAREYRPSGPVITPQQHCWWQ